MTAALLKICTAYKTVHLQYSFTNLSVCKNNGKRITPISTSKENCYDWIDKNIIKCSYSSYLFSCYLFKNYHCEFVLCKQRKNENEALFFLRVWMFILSFWHKSSALWIIEINTGRVINLVFVWIHPHSLPAHIYLERLEHQSRAFAFLTPSLLNFKTWLSLIAFYCYLLYFITLLERYTEVYTWRIIFWESKKKLTCINAVNGIHLTELRFSYTHAKPRNNVMQWLTIKPVGIKHIFLYLSKCFGQWKRVI